MVGHDHECSMPLDAGGEGRGGDTATACRWRQHCQWRRHGSSEHGTPTGNRGGVSGVGGLSGVLPEAAVLVEGWSVATTCRLCWQWWPAAIRDSLQALLAVLVGAPHSARSIC